MSVGLLETMKQQIGGLDKLQQAELSQFLREQLRQATVEAAPPSLPVSDAFTAEHRRRQHAEWLKAHRAEYGGRYVALDGDRLLGTGKNYPEAAAAARQAGVSNAYVDFVLPPDYEGYLGE
ncbi:MAG: hypothetical protein HYR56_12965 [Acidobacteria bacterium]|nr:hypothetical protein [Acidobacteriota bacterium]MBI3426957.1 hypothetical protein [Acidobacteriota bacterium]